MNTGNSHKIKQHIPIAIVDDNDLIREKISEILIDFGFDVMLKAWNGSELLKQLDGLATLPAICLLDISMPVMNGYETAQNLRQLYPGIKILAFSMDNDELTIKKIVQCGAHAFAEKTIEPFKLKDKLLQILQ
jgi:DNA-binding NarL/FixJ family response regulator